MYTAERLALTNKQLPQDNHASHKSSVLQLAHRDAIKRLLQAFIKENLVKFIHANKNLVIFLEKTENVLAIDDVHIMSLDRYEIHGALNLWDAENNVVRTIDDAEELLEIFTIELSDRVGSASWKKFITEVKDSIHNTALMLNHIQHSHQEIAVDAKEHGHTTLWQWVKAGRANMDPALFFEQFASQGHPHHPCNKTKLGFSEQDVLNYAPEFQPDVPLHLSALHKSFAHIELQKDILDYKEWFAKTYPQWWERWCDKMQHKKLSIDEYVPFPIHPWQQQHKIPEYFSQLIHAEKLHLFTDVIEKAAPTLSFRTVFINSKTPHIKLPVGVQATSGVRIVTPAGVENGPKISQLLKQILQKEGAFKQHLRFMYEEVGLYVKGFNDQVAKNFSALFRDNPNTHLQDGELAITVAALFSHSPISNLPVCVELMRSIGIDDATSARRYFRQYVDIVLHPYIQLYLCYGIALEGHQQNTLAVFDKEFGYPKAMMIRDFGGLRIHKESLEKSGYNIAVYPNSATFTDDLEEVRGKFLHTIYQVHLGEWTYRLAKHYGVVEKIFWNEIKESTDVGFEQLKERLDSKFFEVEKDALLKAAWPFKALLSMRLADVATSYVYTSVRNPFDA